MDNLLPNSSSLAFVEAVYAEYLRDPNAVDPAWRRYFDSQQDDSQQDDSQQEANHNNWRAEPAFRPRSIFNPPNGHASHQLGSAGMPAVAQQSSAPATNGTASNGTVGNGTASNGHSR